MGMANADVPLAFLTTQRNLAGLQAASSLAGSTRTITGIGTKVIEVDQASKPDKAFSDEHHEAVDDIRPTAEVMNLAFDLLAPLAAGVGREQEVGIGLLRRGRQVLCVDAVFE